MHLREQIFPPLHLLDVCQFSQTGCLGLLQTSDGWAGVKAAGNDALLTILRAASGQMLGVLLCCCLCHVIPLGGGGLLRLSIGNCGLAKAKVDSHALDFGYLTLMKLGFCFSVWGDFTVAFADLTGCFVLFVLTLAAWAAQSWCQLNPKMNRLKENWYVFYICNIFATCVCWKSPKVFKSLQCDSLWVLLVCFLVGIAFTIKYASCK